MPDKSGLPSPVLGVGADKFAVPSGSRGVPGVRMLNHCADAGVDALHRRAATATAADRNIRISIHASFAEDGQSVSHPDSPVPGLLDKMSKVQIAKHFLTITYDW